MNRKSRIQIVLLLGFLPVVGVCQEKLEAALGADFVSGYIWRGQKCGGASVQPSASLSYKGLSFGAWGSVGLTDPEDSKELDLTLSYITGKLSFGLTDYYISGDDSRYFLYDSGRTIHTFEAMVGYDFGLASISWYTNFAGNDGINKSGDRAYSSYFEANVPFKLAGVDWTATAGVVPWATTTYGTTGFAVTNLSLRADKDIRITDTFSIPVFGQLVGNPCSQKAYLVFGFTLRP